MTDQELEELTAPLHYGVPDGRDGLFEGGWEERPHRCGRCNNPTGVYHPECPNRNTLP